MEIAVDTIAVAAALAMELTVVVIVLIGGGEALIHVVHRLVRGSNSPWSRRAIWLGYAAWILLALEFALGADIIRAAVAPSWDDIGKLAAIAAIRTGLSFFLERDIGDMSDVSGPTTDPRDKAEVRDNQGQ